MHQKDKGHFHYNYSVLKAKEFNQNEWLKLSPISFYQNKTNITYNFMFFVFHDISILKVITFKMYLHVLICPKHGDIFLIIFNKLVGLPSSVSLCDLCLT